MPVFDPVLEREYNNRALVPEHPAIFDRWRGASAAFRATADADLDLPYGPDGRHRLDLFRAPGARGTVIFIHGGYWRSLDKSDFSFVAAPFIAEGLSVAAFNYRLCPAVGVEAIIGDCRAALAWLLAEGPRHGAPVDRIVLAGHSAGGHLVAMLFATDWRQRGMDPACIAGGVSLSGVADLEPLLKCSMNEDLRLDATTARLVSPVFQRCRLSVPLYLAVGADESPAFRAQTRHLQRVWPTNCPQVEEIAGCNHFTVLDDFVRVESRGYQFVSGLFA
ncbi:MAG: alpha/beta hydrolase [Betaproteobacteria bacterium]